jgi:hypothetical protein
MEFWLLKNSSVSNQQLVKQFVDKSPFLSPPPRLRAY